MRRTRRIAEDYIDLGEYGKNFLTACCRYGNMLSYYLMKFDKEDYSMKQQNRSPIEVVNGIVLNIFKLNGYFIKAADCLTKESELTSARWQILGTVLHDQHTVAAIARSMGLARQSVQRIADVLVIDGLAEFLPNPAHKRAKLLSSTEKGLNTIKKIRPGVVAWAESVNDLIGEDELNDAEKAINNLLSKLMQAEEQLIKGC